MTPSEMIKDRDRQPEAETFVGLEVLIHIILNFAFASRVRESFNISYCQIFKVCDVRRPLELFFFSDCVPSG
jgi:hypothetical protein